jgi:hypothetical protein
MKTISGGAWHRILSMAGAAFMLLAVDGLKADNLWSNGALLPGNYQPAGPGGGNPCDSNICGVNQSKSANPYTIFDNFTIPTGVSWKVSAVDFTDFVVGVSLPPTTGNTITWSIWSGDPVNNFGPPKLLFTGTATASLSSAGSCLSSSCLELFTVNLGSGVTLAGGQTYYLGTSVTNVSAANGGYQTYRVGASGNAGYLATTQGWEQSNGHAENVGAYTTWANGGTSQDYNLPSSTSGVNATDSAFDIIGTLDSGSPGSAPEPGTLTFMGIALLGLGFIRRRT